MEKRLAVIVCTEHRGVFFGYVPYESKSFVDLGGVAKMIAEDGDVFLYGAKMAINWGTTKGVMELADTVPTDKSLISAPADIAINKVSAVFLVTPEAEQAWLASQGSTKGHDGG